MRIVFIASFLAFLLPAFLFAGNGARVAGLDDVTAMADATVESARSAAQSDREAAEQKLMDAWKGSADPNAIPMVGISFPIAHHKNGIVKLQFKADEALLPSFNSAYIRANGITLDLFNQQGAVIATFHGENGLYDRAARVGFCEGPVLISDKDVRIDGTNMIWDLEAQNAKILKNARVMIRAGMMKGIGKAFQ